MADFHSDQAAGLRRLFARTHLPVVAGVAGATGVGKTVCLFNLAATLVQMGKEVLIVDECSNGAGMVGLLGLMAHRDLRDVLDGQVGLEQALLPVGRGLYLLPAQRAAGQAGGVSPTQRRALRDAILTALPAIDLVLVDTSVEKPFAAFGALADEVLLITDPRVGAIRKSYALYKRLGAQSGHPPCRLLLNKLKSESEGQAIHRNMLTLGISQQLPPLPLACMVPQAPTLHEAALRGEAATHSGAAQVFQRLAREVLAWSNRPKVGGDVDHSVRQLINFNSHFPDAAFGAA